LPEDLAAADRLLQLQPRAPLRSALGEREDNEIGGRAGSRGGHFKAQELRRTAGRHVDGRRQANAGKVHHVADALAKRPRSAREQLLLPGDHQLAGRQNLQLAELRLVSSGRQARVARQVADEHAPPGLLGADNRLDEVARQVVPVSNHSRGEPVVGHLRPEVVLVPRQQRVRPVAQVGAHRRAGVDRLIDLADRGGRVADRSDHSAGHHFADERGRSGMLGRKGQHADSSPGRLLQPAEFIPVRRVAVHVGVRAPGAILHRDIGALEVDAGHSGSDPAVLAASLADRSQRAGERGEAIGRDRWEKPRDSKGGRRLDDFRTVFDREPVGAELLAAVAVDLHVEQARRDPGHAARRGVDTSRLGHARPFNANPHWRAGLIPSSDDLHVAFFSVLSRGGMLPRPSERRRSYFDPPARDLPAGGAKTAGVTRFSANQPGRLH